MSGFNGYFWNGKPIKDIREWCKQNKSAMVKYRQEKRFVDMFSLKMEKEVTEGEMPALFFDTLIMDEKSGLFFETSRYEVS